MRNLFLVAALSFACDSGGGADDGPGACRDDGDCGGSESCVPPGSQPACGIPCEPQRECELATDCAAGDACEEYVGSCCSAGDPLSSRCRAPCTLDPCADDERCNTDLVCEAKPCDQGYACPAHTICSFPSGDAHGCVRGSCADDSDCEGDPCVQGLCYSEPGLCTPPAA